MVGFIVSLSTLYNEEELKNHINKKAGEAHAATEYIDKARVRRLQLPL